MSDAHKKDLKEQSKPASTSKSLKPAIPKQPAQETHPTSPKEGKAQSLFDDTKAAAQEEGPFEDVDLSDPPHDEPSFEKIEHRDALHSSYNTQQDHKWKYEKDFGKDQSKGGDGKGKK